MAVSVAAVMKKCRNYFETGYMDGSFRITGNKLLDVPDARYVYISGSMFHDGVWEVSQGYLTGRDVSGLDNEEFSGRVWFLNPPADFLDLCETIKVYEEKNPVGALVQERFGEYSYMRNMRSGSDTGWQATFRNALAPYCRMFSEVS